MVAASINLKTDNSNILLINSNILEISNNINIITGDASFLKDINIYGNLDISGKLLFNNVYDNSSNFPSATLYHGMFAHAHDTGRGYYSHAGEWIQIANYSDLSNITVNMDNLHTKTYIDNCFNNVFSKIEEISGSSLSNQADTSINIEIVDALNHISDYIEYDILFTSEIISDISQQNNSINNITLDISSNTSNIATNTANITNNTNNITTNTSNINNILTGTTLFSGNKIFNDKISITNGSYTTDISAIGILTKRIEALEEIVTNLLKCKKIEFI